MVACTTEMPLPIELVKAQLKVWEYKCVLIVGKPHWPYAYKTSETYTYEYAMLTPSPHKMKLVLTHHVDAHPIPYLHVEVATADKKSSYQKPDIMNKPILIGSLLELIAPQDNKRKDPLWYPIPRRNSNGGALGGCTDLATPTVFLVGRPS